MAEESTQRHTGESAKTPAAHHRASSQDGTASPKKQALDPRWLSTIERIVDLALDFAIRGICLWGAIVSYQHQENGLFFLLCLAVARKELGIFAAIQALVGSVGRLKPGKHAQATQNEKSNTRDLGNTKENEH